MARGELDCLDFERYYVSDEISDGDGLIDGGGDGFAAETTGASYPMHFEEYSASGVYRTAEASGGGASGGDENFEANGEPQLHPEPLDGASEPEGRQCVACGLVDVSGLDSSVCKHCDAPWPASVESSRAATPPLPPGMQPDLASTLPQHYFQAQPPPDVTLIEELQRLRMAVEDRRNTPPPPPAPPQPPPPSHPDDAQQHLLAELRRSVQQQCLSDLQRMWGQCKEQHDAPPPSQPPATSAATTSPSPPSPRSLQPRQQEPEEHPQQQLLRPEHALKEQHTSLEQAFASERSASAAEIHRLEQLVQQLQQQNVSLDDVNYPAEIQRLQRALADQKERYEEEVKALKDTNISLQKRVQAQEERSDTLEKRMQQLRRDHQSELEKETALLRRELDDQMTCTSTTEEKQKTLIKELQAERCSISTELTKVRTAAARMDAELREANRSLKRASDTAAKQEKVIEGSNVELDRLRNELRGMQEKVRKAEVSATKLQAEKGQLLEQIKLEQHNCREKEKEVEVATRELHKTRQEAVESESRGAKLEHSLGEANQDLKSSQKALAKSQSRIEQVQISLADLEKKYQHVLLENSQLKQDNHNQKTPPPKFSVTTEYRSPTPTQRHIHRDPMPTPPPRASNDPSESWAPTRSELKVLQKVLTRYTSGRQQDDLQPGRLPLDDHSQKEGYHQHLSLHQEQRHHQQEQRHQTQCSTPPSPPAGKGSLGGGLSGLAGFGNEQSAPPKGQSTVQWLEDTLVALQHEKSLKDDELAKLHQTKARSIAERKHRMQLEQRIMSLEKEINTHKRELRQITQRRR